MSRALRQPFMGHRAAVTEEWLEDAGGAVGLWAVTQISLKDSGEDHGAACNTWAGLGQHSPSEPGQTCSDFETSQFLKQTANEGSERGNISY